MTLQNVGCDSVAQISGHFPVKRTATLEKVNADPAAAEHGAILKAIRKRDPDAAEVAARNHMAAAQRARLQLLPDTEGAKMEETS